MAPYVLTNRLRREIGHDCRSKTQNKKLYSESFEVLDFSITSESIASKSSSSPVKQLCVIILIAVFNCQQHSAHAIMIYLTKRRANSVEKLTANKATNHIAAYDSCDFARSTVADVSWSWDVHTLIQHSLRYVTVRYVAQATVMVVCIVPLVCPHSRAI